MQHAAMSLSALEQRPFSAAKRVKSREARGSGRIGNWSNFERGLHAREDRPAPVEPPTLRAVSVTREATRPRPPGPCRSKLNGSTSRRGVDSNTQLPRRKIAMLRLIVLSTTAAFVAFLFFAIPAQADEIEPEPEPAAEPAARTGARPNRSPSPNRNPNQCLPGRRLCAQWRLRRRQHGGCLVYGSER